MDRHDVFHLELDLSRGPEDLLTGLVSVSGAPSKRFTGWIGLTAAIDGMLAVAEELAGGEPQAETHL